MDYSTFQVGIRSGDSMRYVDVVACDAAAAHADLRAAYGEDLEIITTKAL